MIDLETDWPAYPAEPTPMARTTRPHEARGSSSQWRTAEAVETDDEGDGES